MADINISFVGRDQRLALAAANRAATQAEAAEQHKLGAELARDQAADLVLPENIFVAADLATATANGEAAVAEGVYFKAVGQAEGLTEVRVRTSGGSTLLYGEVTSAALAADDGGDFIGYKRTGGSAVSRTVKDLLDDIEVSVLDYGAVLDGETDCAAAINAALAAHTRVYIPAGVALVSTTIIVPSGRILRGAGVGQTTIKLADDAECVIITNEHGQSVGGDSDDTDTDIYLADFTVDGNRTGQSNEGWWTGVELTWVEHALIERVHTKDTYGHGFCIGASRHVTVRQCRAENFGDDGFTASDVNTDFTRPSRFILFEDCYAKTADKIAAVTFGSGFEADDGVRDVHFVRCTAEACLVSFYADWSSTSGIPTPTGNLHYEECISIDPTVGHYHFVGHYTQELDGIFMRNCSASGIPTSPNSVTGALSISNGIWKNVQIDGFVAIDAGRLNLRGIHGGSVRNIIFNDSLNRVDIRGDTLGAGAITTYIREVEFSNIQIQAASVVLLRDHQNVKYTRLDCTGLPYVQLMASESVTIDGWSVIEPTHATQGFLLGGGASAETEVGIKLRDGAIVDPAGSGLVVQPSGATDAIVDTSIVGLRVDRADKSGFRISSGGAGGVRNTLVQDMQINDACQNTPGSTDQVQIGSSSAAVIEGLRFLNLKIRKTSGGGSNATRGITLIDNASITDVFVAFSDIAASGSSGDYFDPDNVITWSNTIGEPV